MSCDLDRIYNLFSRFSTETQFNQWYTNKNGILSTPHGLKLCLRCMPDTEFDSNNIEINIIIACLMKLLMDYHEQIKIWKNNKLPPPFLINCKFIDNILLIIKTSTNGYEYVDKKRAKNIYNDPRNGTIIVKLKNTPWLNIFIESLNKENKYLNKNTILENIDQLTFHIYHNIKYHYESLY